MTYVTIAPDGVKLFMAKLFSEDAFDAFVFKKAAIDNFARFDAEARAACAWARMRPYLAALLKGGGKPDGMKVALEPPLSEIADGLSEEIFAERDPVVNVIFNERGVTLTFGGAWRSMAEQREKEEIIKRFVIGLLSQHHIIYTEE